MSPRLRGSLTGVVSALLLGGAALGYAPAAKADASGDPPFSLCGATGCEWPDDFFAGDGSIIYPYDRFFRYHEMPTGPARDSSLGLLAGEDIDLFTGTLKIVREDVYLPGKAGLDLRIVRAYSSKLWARADVPAAYENLALFGEGKLRGDPGLTPLGMGWSVHMGRLIEAASGHPTYESAEGTYREFFPSGSGAYWASKDGWRLEGRCNGVDGLSCVWSDTGVRYEIGRYATGVSVGGGVLENVGQVTKIVDPFGNAIEISYRSDGAIDSILDSYGRQLRFAYDDDGTGPRLVQITSDSPRIGYSYSYITASCPSCAVDGVPSATRLLAAATPLAGPSEEYEYNVDGPVLSNRYALARVTLPWRGSVVYSYASTPFFVGLHVVPFSVLSQRAVYSGPEDSVGRQWTYSYVTPFPGEGTPDPFVVYDPLAVTTDMNVTVVTRPDGLTDGYTFYGFGWVQDQATNQQAGGYTYLVGLPHRVVRADGAVIEQFDWRVGPSEQALSTSKSKTAYGPPHYSWHQDPPFCTWWLPDTIQRPSWCYLWDGRTVTPVLVRHQIASGNGLWVTSYSDFDGYNQPHTVQETGAQAGLTPEFSAPQHRTSCLTYDARPVDVRGATLNLVHGLVLTQDVCVGNGCDCHGADAIHSEFAYGARGELSWKEVSGVRTRYDYDGYGDLARVTDAAENSLQLAGYTFGVPTDLVQNGKVHTYRSVGWEGWIESVTDPRGYVTSYEYDAAGRLTKLTPPGVAVPTTIVYDDDAYGTTSLVRRGAYWRTTIYDGLGRATASVDSEGVQTTERYDDPMGWSSFRSYPFDADRGEVGDKLERDGLGRLVIRTKAYRPAVDACDAPGACIETVDYEYANCEATTVERGVGSSSGGTRCYRSYGDPSDRELVGAESAGDVWTYPRDAAGALTSVVAPSPGGDRSYAYDEHHFPAADFAGETGLTQRWNNAIGQPIATLDSVGVTKSFAYDDLGRLSNVTYTDAQGQNVAAEAVTRAYDPAGHLTYVATPNAGAEFFAFDELGRVTEQKWTWGDASEHRLATTNYHYDRFGCLDTIVYPTGVVLTMTCDAQNRVTAIWDADQLLVSSVAYHPTGQISSMTLGNGLITTYSYDDRGRTTSIEDPETTLTYTYDGADNVLTFANSLFPGDSRAMLYDTADRLIWSASVSGGWSGASYYYDALGNRSVEGQVTGDATYAYDAANRLTTVSGKQLGDLDLAWSTTGNLAAANGEAYTYDGLGRRVRKDGPDGATLFHYDAAGRVIAETREDGSALRSYVYLAGKLVAVVGCISPGVTSCNEREWYHTDTLGSVVARTNPSGAVTAALDYDPYGGVLSAFGEAGDRQYNGRVFDTATGLHDYGARMYWPQIGRFVNADTYAGDIAMPASLNLYGYVHNNPYKYTDATGHCPMCIGAAIGGGVGGIGGAIWAWKHGYSWTEGRFWKSVGVGAGGGAVIGGTLGWGASAIAGGEGAAAATTALGAEGTAAPQLVQEIGAAAPEAEAAVYRIAENLDIPKVMESAGQVVRILPSAVKHVQELAARSQTAGTPLSMQLLQESYVSAVNKAMQVGIQYGTKMYVGGWELIFQRARDGGSPVLIHALQASGTGG